MTVSNDKSHIMENPTSAILCIKREGGDKFAVVPPGGEIDLRSLTPNPEEKKFDTQYFLKEEKRMTPTPPESTSSSTEKAQEVYRSSSPQ